MSEPERVLSDWTASAEKEGRPVKSRFDHSRRTMVNKLTMTQSAMSIIALILASVAIGVLVLMPAYIDAKVQAGVAKSEATAQTAKEHARVALDKVEQTQVQLGAKGLVQPSTH